MDVEFTPSAHSMDRNSRTRLVSCNPAEGILGAAHGRAVDGQNEVAGLQSRLLRGAAHIQVGNQYAALGETVLGGLLVRDVLGHDSDPAANDAPIRNDVAEYTAHHVDRNREPDALDPQVLGDDGRVDADECAARVHQRSARVSEIDRRIGLDEVLEGCDAQLLTAGCAHDAVCHGLRQANRVADRQYDIANLELIGTTEHRDGQRRQVNFEHREICIWIASDNVSVRDAAVSERHLDGVGVRDHVMVGHDVPGVVHDDPRAEGALNPLPVSRQEAAEQFTERRGRYTFGYQTGRVDIYYGRRCPLNGGGGGHPDRR